MSRARNLMHDYLERTKRPGEHHNDVAYNFQLHVLRDLLTRLEVILEDEMVPPVVIERVIRCMLYGSPHPADALLRQEEMRKLAELVTLCPPRRLFGPQT